MEPNSETAKANLSAFSRRLPPGTYTKTKSRRRHPKRPQRTKHDDSAKHYAKSCPSRQTASSSSPCVTRAHRSNSCGGRYRLRYRRRRGSTSPRRERCDAPGGGRRGRFEPSCPQTATRTWSPGEVIIGEANKDDAASCGSGLLPAGHNQCSLKTAKVRSMLAQYPVCVERRGKICYATAMGDARGKGYRGEGHLCFSLGRKQPS